MNVAVYDEVVIVGDDPAVAVLDVGLFERHHWDQEVEEPVLAEDGLEVLRGRYVFLGPLTPAENRLHFFLLLLFVRGLA